MLKTKNLLLFSALFFLLSLASAHAAVYAQTQTGTVTIPGQQYFNISNGTESDASGHVFYDNRSGITLDFDTSGMYGFFNATTNTIDGLGPNLNLNKTYKVPNASDTSTWGDTFYVDQTFPLYQDGDGLMVRLANNTYAAFVVMEIQMDGTAAMNITVDYYYNANGSNLFSDKPTTGCGQHQTEQACYDSAKTGASCYWDSWLSMCNEAGSSGGGGAGGPVSGGAGFVDCAKFDNNQKACGNITVCSYANSLCDPTPGGGFSTQVGLNCSVFNNQSLCDNQPHSNPLCSWDGASCLTNNTKTASDTVQPVFSTCNLAPTQAECNNLTTEAYMPCEWDVSTSKCFTILNSVYGGAAFGDIFDITTKSACEAVGGTWKTETYSYTNSYGQVQTSTDSWCEPSFADYSKETCADSCWACERKPDGTSWGTGASAVSAAKEACLNSSVGYCEFYQDSYAVNGLGWCEPSSKVSFGFMDCSSNCFGCFSNATCAASAATCVWTSDQFGFDIDGNGSFDNQTDGFCDPTALAAKKDCSQNCFACSTNASCAGSAANVSEGGCTWNSQNYYCTNTSATPLEICFLSGDEDGNGLYDCADPACAQEPSCGFGSGGNQNLGMGNIDPWLCIQHDNDAAGCTGQTGPAGTPLASVNICYYHPAPDGSGNWCDPVFNQEASGGMNMDAPPVIIGIDQPGDVADPWLDIVGFGLHDSPESFDIGIAVSNMSNFTGCYKSNPNTYNFSGRYYRYIDVDGNTTNSCNPDDDSTIKGFEYKFIHTANNNESNSSIYPFYNATFDNKLAYKCVSESWVPYSAKLNSMPEGCSFSDGALFSGVDILIIKKSDIGSPKVPVRIYVATHNGSNSTLDSAGPAYYTPGSIDFKFEDCSATGQDFDGDGLKAENDPDCQKFIKLGYIPFEGGPQCNDGKDNDGNGLTDCNDFSCKYDPYSGCGFALTCDTNDKSAPSVKWHEVNALVDSAHVAFDSNEPANGTLLFYNLSSACTSLNATLKDTGLLDSFTDNDYKMWHDTEIDAGSIGFNLDPGTNYFYKYKMCDLCGNCIVSQCGNFTTASSFKSFIFKPVLPENITMSIPNLSIINNTFAYGKKLNQSQTKNLEITVNDTFHDYGITMQNCTVTEAFDVNLSNAFVYNESTKATGMDTDKWNEVSQELGCKNIKVKIPTSSTANQLWHCDDDNVSNCYQVDSSELVTCTFDSISAECSISVAQGLGFSLYEPRSSGGGGGTSSSSTGGGGGGGGGGGTAAATSTLASKVSKVWDVIAADELKLLTVNSEKISVSLLTFSLSNEVTNAEVTLGTLTELPSAVKPTGLPVYQNLQVIHAKIPSSYVASVSVEFEVTLDWLSTNDVEASQIALYRYDETAEKWDELATTHLRSDAEKAYYSAKSPGLSYFAVAAKAKKESQAEPEVTAAPTTGAVVEEPPKVVAEAPRKQGLPSWWVYAALTAVVIIVAAAIVSYEKRKHSKPKNPEI